jgi:hypothetical protein
MSLGKIVLADRVHRLTYRATRNWSSSRRTGRTGLTGLRRNCFTDRIHRLTYRHRDTRRWSYMSRCGNGRRTGRTGITGLCGSCFTDRIHRLTYRVTRRWSSTSRCGNGRRTGRTGGRRSRKSRSTLSAPRAGTAPSQAAHQPIACDGAGGGEDRKLSISISFSAEMVRSQPPPTQWNLRGGRWSSVE